MCCFSDGEHAGREILLRRSYWAVKGWKQAETCRDSKASWRVGRVAEAVSLVGTV
jgi:hypothetical protein